MRVTMTILTGLMMVLTAHSEIVTALRPAIREAAAKNGVDPVLMGVGIFVNGFIVGGMTVTALAIAFPRFLFSFACCLSHLRCPTFRSRRQFPLFNDFFSFGGAEN